MKKRVTFWIVFLFLELPFYCICDDNAPFKIIHGPYLQNVTETSAAVIFKTNKPAVPGVNIKMGNTTRFIQNSHDGLMDGGGLLHKVHISGLIPGQQYEYEIFAREIVQFEPYKIIYGDTVSSSPNYSFITLSTQKKEIKFTVFSDIHGNADKLGNFLDKNSIEDQDCYFFNGDMMSSIEEDIQLFGDFLDTAIACFASSKPFYFVRGNHEARGKHARNIKNYFDFTDNKYYYAFTHGPVHFVILDCGEDKPDDNQYYYGLADFDSYRLEELEWLKKHVKSNEFRKALIKIVLIHMPVIKQKNNWHGMEFLASHFGPVLDKAGINLMISGHLHENSWLNSGESGFSYPVLICSNDHFIEVSTNKKSMTIQIKDVNGKIERCLRR